jgi:hypothetical protein
LTDDENDDQSLDGDDGDKSGNDVDSSMDQGDVTAGHSFN